MRRLIMFLIRRKLGVKKFEYFQFTNQKSDDVYFMTSRNLIKIVSRKPDGRDGYIEHPIYEGKAAKYARSTASLNWIISGTCDIRVLPVKKEG